MPLKFLKKSRQYDVFSKDFNMFTIVCLGNEIMLIYSSVEFVEFFDFTCAYTLTQPKNLLCVNLDQVFLTQDTSSKNVLKN